MGGVSYMRSIIRGYVRRAYTMVWSKSRRELQTIVPKASNAMQERVSVDVRDEIENRMPR